MSANLTAPKIKASIEGNFTKSQGLYPLSTGLIQAAFSLVPPTANSGVAMTITLAASASQTVDLVTGTDPLGDAVAGTKALGIIIIPTGTNGIVQAAPAASNGLVWFWAGTSPVLTVPSGAVLLYGDPVGTTIDSTHKELTFTNTGTGSVTFGLVIFCKQ